MPRKYVRAKIVNYDITETKKGDPQATVLFEYTEGEGLNAVPKQITWWGHTSEKAMPITLKALYIMGFQGKSTQDFVKLADGVMGGALDLGKEVDLVLDEDKKDDGKTYWKVAFINDPDTAPGKGFKGSMPKDKIKLKLGAMNLEGQMAMIRKELGGQAPKPQPKPAAVAATAMMEPGDDSDFDFGPA